MKQTWRRVKWIAILLSAVALVAVAALCGLAFTYQRLQDQARVALAPPAVFVTEPLPGTSAPTGSHLLVSATALSDTPITRAELWLDGELIETQEAQSPEGVSPFHFYSGLLVRRGAQQILVRAVNSTGIIGQSVPVGVVGSDVPEEALEAVQLGPGETLGDIARAREVELPVIEELNPDLDGEEAPEGTVVIVPPPPAEEPPESVGPSVPPSGSGTTPPAPSPPGSGGFTVPAGPPLTIIPPATLPALPWNPLLVVPVLKPPAAPDGLQGAVENCMVRLRWNDNAHDEARYEVWMAPLSGSQWLIAKLSPAAGGAAWYEFPAPQTGGLSFWVKAVGVFGSQPSNIVWLEIDGNCPTRSPTHLEVETLDMSIRGSQDKVYCYASFENAPEERIPGDDSSFIQVQGGQGDIAAWASGSKKFVVPIPADGTLDIAGECWGWSGAALDKLGHFGDSTTSSQWTGTRLVLSGGGYEIGYAVASAGGDGSAGQETAYSYEDPTLPSPYNLSLLGKSIPGVPGSGSTTLYWDWSGDQSKLTGFTVFLNAYPYRVVSGGDKRGIQVQLPTTCGRTYKWQVAALAGQAQSRLSAAYDFHTEPCPVFVEVQFKELDILCSENYWFLWTCPNCGEIGSWWTLYANDQKRKSYYSNLRRVIKCGTYQMSQIDMNKGDTLVVPISASDPTLKVGSMFFYMNHWGEPRRFQDDSRTLTMSLDQWKTYDSEFELWTKANGVYSNMTVRVHGPDAGGSTP